MYCLNIYKILLEMQKCSTPFLQNSEHCVYIAGKLIRSGSYEVMQIQL